MGFGISRQMPLMIEAQKAAGDDLGVDQRDSGPAEDVGIETLESANTPILLRFPHQRTKRAKEMLEAFDRTARRQRAGGVHAVDLLADQRNPAYSNGIIEFEQRLGLIERSGGQHGNDAEL